MSPWFWVTTVIFMAISVIMVLIVLVQRPQGGGLAGAFGGAGGAGTETVFGGRVGDALTWFTVIAFAVYLSLAIALNLMDNTKAETAGLPAPAGVTAPLPEGEEGEPEAGLGTTPTGTDSAAGDGQEDG
jgi:preprotein translocase subunit SecG